MNKINALYRKHIRVIPGVKSYVLATVFIFLFGMVLTLVAWQADRTRVQDQRQDELSQQVASIENSITNRLNVYEQILRGASGLVGSSDDINQEKWQRFVGQYDLANAYPGISGVGYIYVVKDADLPAFTERMRATSFPDFKVMPEGKRTEYAPIAYIQSTSSVSNSVIGYDVLTNPLRIESANRARDNGKLSISDKLTLLSDEQSGAAGSPGFIMYVATYKESQPIETVEQRRQALSGFVFAGFRAKNFFGKVIESSDMKLYTELSVFDGNSVEPDSLLYASENFDSKKSSGRSASFKTNFFNHEWTLQFAGPVNSVGQDNQRSTLILVGGIILSAAVAGFLFLIMFTRARDIVYVKQKEAQQAKDDLLSLASHQLRTPATAVKQYLGMVLEGYTGPIDEKQAPALQKAYLSNERQLEIINQILYVAKADAGRLSINRSKFDLNVLVRDIALDLEDTIQERGQSIHIVNHKKLSVSADEASMRMVIENLISNASKYSHHNGVITIKTGLNNGKVFVSVTDEGVGIEPDDFDKLFKKFSRIDNELSLQVGGSGIGLYIDKVLIELHGGTIKVESKPEEGSTFTIYIPKKVASNLTDDNSKGAIQ